jgi:hypothetical protein
MCGSSNRAPALQAQIPVFKPIKYHQERKELLGWVQEQMNQGNNQ